MGKDESKFFRTQSQERFSNFFINHSLDVGKQLLDQNDGEVICPTTTPWKMYFDGSSL